MDCVIFLCVNYLAGGWAGLLALLLGLYDSVLMLIGYVVEHINMKLSWVLLINIGVDVKYYLSQLKVSSSHL